MANNIEECPKKLRPFKLSFVPEKIPGRSDIYIGKSKKAVGTITPKFYCQRELEVSCSKAEFQKQINCMIVKGPREKYSDPVTENQRYGWYQINFNNYERGDRRLNFAKHTNPIVREHLMNYANIR